MNPRTLSLLFAATALLAPALASGQASPAGTWAQLVTTTAVSRLPFIGEIITRTRVYSLVTIEEVADGLRMTTSICWVRMDGDVEKVRPIVPDAAVDAMGPKTRSGRWSTASGNTAVTFPAVVDVLGAELDRPHRDPLPIDTDDTRVIDEDHDGHPGVTIRMIGLVDGELRVVQRTTNSFHGAVSPSGDTITGRVTWRSEQKVLDATNAFLRTSPRSRPHPDPALSHFLMKRVPKTLRCEGLLQGHATLFP